LRLIFLKIWKFESLQPHPLLGTNNETKKNVMSRQAEVNRENLRHAVKAAEPNGLASEHI
jgi:hypothetical protein